MVKRDIKCTRQLRNILTWEFSNRFFLLKETKGEVEEGK